jgi:enamine deaminase RidA (YjgF/YER057c/UK114 family)
VTTPSKRLDELGITLPPVPTPAGAYVPARRTGSLVFTAGQVPLVDGKPAALGKLGAEIDPEEGYRLARICALNALAAAAAVTGGLGRIGRVVKVTGYVASAPGFNRQPEVINGASELVRQLFGDAGLHARAAVGAAELPLDAPVEVELVVELGDSPADQA